MKKRITHVVLSAMMLFVFMLFLGVSQSQAASADTKGTLATVGKVTISSLKLDKNNYLVIKWKEVDGVSGYRVYRKTETDTKWVKVTTTTKTSCTDKKVKATAGSAVQYRVRAYLT